MGNGSSCFYMQHSMAQKKIAKVIDTRGNVRQVKLPARAAEQMLEETGCVVSPVDQLRSTRRLSAMRADDELLAGKVYMLVPVGRVGSKVTEAEMAIVDAACNSNSNKRRSLLSRGKKRRSGKVLPAVAAAEESRAEGKSEIKVLGEEGSEVVGNYGLRKYRQTPWSPVLEPISEGL